MNDGKDKAVLAPRTSIADENSGEPSWLWTDIRQKCGRRLTRKPRRRRSTASADL
jgi:hypothetical protein